MLGGDQRERVIPGADVSLTGIPTLKYLLFGNCAALEPVLDDGWPKASRNWCTLK
jgi:hypothetical protein